MQQNTGEKRTGLSVELNGTTISKLIDECKMDLVLLMIVFIHQNGISNDE